jgi:arginyl-tRNA synthetase
MAMMITEALSDAIQQAFLDLGVDRCGEEVHLERPARPEHGDLSSNVALVVAQRLGRAPRALAEEIASVLSAAQLTHVDKIDVAGPGFINFHLHDSWLHALLHDAVSLGEERYARIDIGHGEKVQVEFVSANPTGPLHVGNGWLGSYGDALARLLDRCGYVVSREYYVNDTGNQVRVLGESLLARRRGDAVSEEGYKGAYVTDLAGVYDGPDDVIQAGRFATDRILSSIRATLDRLGIVFDEWYSQASIEESGKLEVTIEEMRSRGLVYERDGATWLASSELGDSRDRVLIKENGDATYLAGDLAYHRDKFIDRGFDRVIDVFGADHHGQVASLHAGIEALGIDRSRLEVKLGQLVSLVGQKMSKRSGNFVRLDDLIDVVGADATRLLSLLSSIDQATTLDLDEVTKKSMESPVYYVQYAYARISSIDRVRQDRAVSLKALDDVDLSVLTHARELALIRVLADLPDVLAEATRERAPYKVTNWVRHLASEFHGFYHDCRVLGDDVDEALSSARLVLVEGARIGLSIGLSLLGVRAPESM